MPRCLILRVSPYSCFGFFFPLLANLITFFYEELGKYGDVDNQVLGCERGEELESSIRYYCSHKIAGSNLQTSELVGIGGTEGPALDLFSAKLEVTPEF